MNKRILSPQLLKLVQAAGPEHSSANPQWVKNFAELIVRECVKEIEFQYGSGSDQPMDSEWDRAIECASSMVKYRFGVEE